MGYPKMVYIYKDYINVENICTYIEYDDDDDDDDDDDMGVSIVMGYPKMVGFC